MKYLLLIFLSFSLGAAQPLGTEPVIPAKEAALYRESVALLNEKPTEALSKLQAAKADSSAAFDFLRGVAHQRLKQANDAEKNFQKALAKFPRFYQARLALSAIYLNREQTQKALTQMLEIVKLGMADGALWKNIAFCHLERKNYHAAWEAIRQARVFLPEEKSLDRLCLDIRLRQEDYAQARNLAAELLDKNPQEKQLWMTLVQCLLQLDKNRQALLNLELCDRLLGLNASERKLLGDLAYNEGLYGKAAENYLKIEGDENLSGDLELRAAHAYSSLGKPEKVIETLKNEDKNLSPAQKEQRHQLRAAAYEQLQQSENALAEYRLALQYNALNALCLFKIAEFSEAAGDTESALDFYSRAQKDPRYRAAALLRKARIHLLEGRKRDALRDAQDALNHENTPANRAFLEQIKAMQ
jgi:tetratricopeptide (TPR) repeat protein